METLIDTAPAVQKNAAPERSCTFSLVVPVYRNEANIGDLIEALEELNMALRSRLEVVFVIDGSPDNSGELLTTALPNLSFQTKIAFHSRNFGSFAAIRTGLELVSGDYVAVMAADLQEPPSLVVQFFEVLERGEVDVVFGQRAGRDDSLLNDVLSNSFWWLYRKLIVRDVPKGGVDIFGCNMRARDAVLSISEPNSSLIAQLFWIGFRREFVPYVRRPRMRGESAWKLSRRVRYMMDSIFSFSDLPILLVLWVGVLGCILSVLFGIAVAAARIFGLIVEPGYASLVLLIAFFGSASLAVQGIIGSYLWRTFENTKQRPLRIISHVLEGHPGDG